MSCLQTDIITINMSSIIFLQNSSAMFIIDIENMNTMEPLWPFKRGGFSSGVELNTFMFRFTLSVGLSRGVSLSSGWPLKRGSTVVSLH